MITFTEPKPTQCYEVKNDNSSINAFHGTLLSIVTTLPKLRNDSILKKLLDYLDGSDEPADNLLGTNSFALSPQQRWAGVQKIAQQQLKKKSKTTAIKKAIRSALFKENKVPKNERYIERFCQTVVNSTFDEISCVTKDLAQLQNTIKTGLYKTSNWLLNNGATVEELDDKVPFLSMSEVSFS